MSDLDLEKVKQLINSDDIQNQVIGIQLLVNTLGYSIEDAGLFYFFNKKPIVSFLTIGKNEKTDIIWNRSKCIVGQYTILFIRITPEDKKKYFEWFVSLNDDLCNYYSILMNSLSEEIVLKLGCSMEGNPPIREFFRKAIELNL